MLTIGYNYWLPKMTNHVTCHGLQKEYGTTPACQERQHQIWVIWEVLEENFHNISWRVSYYHSYMAIYRALVSHQQPQP